MSSPTVSPLRKLVSQPIPKPPSDEGQQEEEAPSFHFKEITPEDWRANEAPLADLYQRGLVSAEYVRQRLKIPDEAGKGTMAPQQAQKPLPDVKSEVPERWRLQQTKRGIVAERLG
jgi:hypothetical protein